jgi:hypothetical protein
MLALMMITTLTTASGCDDPKGTTSGSSGSAGRAAPTSAVTVHYDPGGKAKVDGAPLHGDPKVCAAFKTCCGVPALSLFCGLSQVKNEGDCAKSLKEVRAYADEAHVATPAGCR